MIAKLLRLFWDKVSLIFLFFVFVLIQFFCFWILLVSNGKCNLEWSVFEAIYCWQMECCSCTVYFILQFLWNYLFIFWVVDGPNFVETSMDAMLLQQLIMDTCLIDNDGHSSIHPSKKILFFSAGKNYFVFLAENFFGEDDGLHRRNFGQNFQNNYLFCAICYIFFDPNSNLSCFHYGVGGKLILIFRHNLEFFVYVFLLLPPLPPRYLCLSCIILVNIYFYTKSKIPIDFAWRKYMSGLERAWGKFLFFLHNVLH